ncbi:MAG: hypothetical protein WBD25_04860 [Terriglobales bacterium]|jgi:hypothetical protein
MKIIFAVILFIVSAFVVSAFAQDYAARTTAEAACGSSDVKFDVKQDATQHPVPQPEPGKALVFVVEDLGQCSSDCGDNGKLFSNNVDQALTKVGMDGSWLGANQGSSYFFFVAYPGEHHLCINWQSRLAVRSRAFAMANFTAEEGKVYYFRERVFPGESDYSFDLDNVNSDQGKFLVASSVFSVSHPKK